MKIRNGFVSNSSSSSFIIGYGIVKNEKKLAAYLKKHGIKLDWSIKILDNGVSRTPQSIPEDRILVGGNNTELEIPIDLFTDETLFVADVLNDEGDSLFYNEEMEDLDWSIADDICFYNASQQALIELFSQKDIIKDGTVQFGAERNG